jgi:hypothetical protein
MTTVSGSQHACKSSDEVPATTPCASSPRDLQIKRIREILPKDFSMATASVQEIVTVLVRVSEVTRARQDELAAALNVPPARVSQYLQLKDLHPDLLPFVFVFKGKKGMRSEGRFTLSLATVIAKQPLDKQGDIAQVAYDRHMTECQLSDYLLNGATPSKTCLADTPSGSRIKDFCDKPCNKGRFDEEGENEKTPVEIGYALQDLVCEKHVKCSDIARSLGKPTEWVSDHLQLCKLNRDLHKYVSRERVYVLNPTMTVDIAAIIAGVNPSFQRMLWNVVRNRRFSAVGLKNFLDLNPKYRRRHNESVHDEETVGMDRVGSTDVDHLSMEMVEQITKESKGQNDRLAMGLSHIEGLATFLADLGDANLKGLAGKLDSTKRTMLVESISISVGFLNHIQRVISGRSL